MPANDAQSKKTDPEQEQLKVCYDEMVAAFNRFHETLMRLDKQQKQVIAQINRHIDQKKIDQIKEVLNQTTT